MPFELTPEQVAWIIVGVIVIFGVWLAGLSYLMWRSYLLRKAQAKPAEPLAEPEKKD
jgi:hypothetical protein